MQIFKIEIYIFENDLSISTCWINEWKVRKFNEQSLASVRRPEFIDTILYWFLSKIWKKLIYGRTYKRTNVYLDVQTYR